MIFNSPFPLQYSKVQIVQVSALLGALVALVLPPVPAEVGCGAFAPTPRALAPPPHAAPPSPRDRHSTPHPALEQLVAKGLVAEGHVA